MGAETYDNKSLSTIQTDVEKEFKAIENREEGLFKWWYRDDQQIYDAGINVIDRYINQLATAKSMWVSNEKWWVNEWKAKLIKSENIFKEEALTYFRQEKSNFQQKWHEVVKQKNILWTWAYITSPSENKVQINEVASAINTAEEDALKKIKLVCNPKQENVNAEEQSSVVRDKQWNVRVNNWEIVRQEPMFHTDKKTGVMTFTYMCNKLSIDQALHGLFTNDDIDYEIDYTYCTNQKVKEKMMEFTWWEAKCLIKKDKEKWTYLIRNKEGQTTENRALIWEWVRLKRDELKQWEAREQKKAQNAKLWHIDAKIDDPTRPEDDPKLQKFVEKIPEALRDKLRNLWNTEYRRFIIEHENRLNVILKKWKAENYEIETEPVSEELFWLLEVHFVSGYAEMDISVRKDKSVLWNNLYNLLYNNINDYKTYLTTRVSEKRLEFEDLTQVEEINVNKRENEEWIDKEGKKQILYWLYLLDKLVDNYRNSEWDSWADDDDNDLAAITKIIRDARFSIWNASDIWQQAIIENIINPIWEKWSKIKHIEKMNNTEYGTYENPDYEEQYNQLKNIFFWTKDQQIEWTRNIWTYGRIFDKTETSFLEDEIMATEIKQNEDGTVTITWWLEINDSNLNKCFQKIKTWLFVDLQYDTTSWDLIENQTTKLIDDLYDAASSDTSWWKIIDILVNNGMIPSEWKNNSDVKEKTKELAKILNKQVEVIDSFTIENIRTSEEKERLELEMKSDKTEDDMERLQALNYMKDHPEEANDMYEKTLQKTKDELKYWWINDIVCKALVSVFVEEWWWAKWDNANIYNDIVWYWFWNLSDSNAKVMWEILVEIAITVAIAVVTWWAWAAAMAAILRSWALAARWARWVNLATKLAKVIEITQKWYKWLKWWGKAIKLWYRATSLLLEGTIFNAASDMVHSAMNWTSLDELDLNVTSLKNIQTAAFLWALSFGNQLAWAVMKRWWQTKIGIDIVKWLEKAHLKAPTVRTTQVVTELTTMLWAEEIINITFWHDVVDPDTKKVHKERTLARPTQEELCQTVGMILAFKAVKPQLWAKYEQQLNDWTLEICRSTKVNEVLLRNTKTWEIKKIKDLVDGKYDNYRTTPEQHRLNNQNKWLEKQSQYETEYNESKKIISELPEDLRSDTMKKLLNVNDMIELSSNDIKRLQKEIWLTWEDVNWVIWPKTLEKLTEYVNKKTRAKKVWEDYDKALESLWTDERLDKLDLDDITDLDDMKYKHKKIQYEKIKNFNSNTEFMSEHDLYKIFDERISVCKSKWEINEFLVKRNATLEYFSGNEVRFRDPKTKEIVEWKNIVDYGESLFGDKFQTPECQKLRKVMEEFMFNQSLDNPLQYNSHWFDHSILVDAYSQMVIDKESIRVVSEKYWISSEWAEVLLRLSAVFHDFWYPEIVKVDENWNVTLTMDKSMHWLEWWLLFENEIAPAFREVMKMYWAEWAKLDQAVKDMRDAISFHSADKIEEPPYKFKLHTKKWEILINEDLNDACAKWIKDSYCNDGDIVEIHTQDWAFNENSKAFNELKSKLESQWIKVNEKPIIDEPTNRYTTSVEEKWTTNQYYRWRKWHKWWPIWIEIQPIDLHESPLAGVVRLADNMDMAFNRLSEVQKNPVFMDLMYNLWMDAVWDWKWNPPASKIFQEMEWLSKAAENLKKWEITVDQFKLKVDEFLNKYWEITTLELFTYDAKTWTRNPELSWTMEFDSSWKSDIEWLKSKEVGNLEKEALNVLNKFKDSLVTELNDLEYPEWWPRWENPYFDVIKWVSQEEKTWSWSLRHVAWLTCIEDAFIEDWHFVVTLDPKVYYNSALSRQTVKEKWESIPIIDWKSDPINVNDYHIWRLFDASSKVTIEGQVSNVMMTDAQNNLMWVITRCSETWKFKPYYTLMDWNWNIVKNAQWKAIFVDKFSDAQTYYQLSTMETSAEFTPKDRQDMLNAIIKEWKSFAELQEIYKNIKWLKEWMSIDDYKDDSRIYWGFGDY